MWLGNFFILSAFPYSAKTVVAIKNVFLHRVASENINLNFFRFLDFTGNHQKTPVKP
jgi:hypothetical protein